MPLGTSTSNIPSLPTPRRSNGHIIYYAGGHELALEMRFPDAVHGEVPQVVYAFRGHLLSPPKILLHQGLCIPSLVPPATDRGFSLSSSGARMRIW